MLAPQFSLRWLLSLLTLCAGLSLLLSFAYRGHAWAMAIVIGLLSAVTIVWVHALVFWLVWLFSQFIQRRQAAVRSRNAERFAGPAQTSDMIT